jgi:hypothetical protein
MIICFPTNESYFFCCQHDYFLNVDNSSSSNNNNNNNNNVKTSSMTGKLRTGVFGTFATYEALELYFDTVVDQSGGTAGDQNVLHLAILDTAMGGRFNDDKYVLLSMCGGVWWCCGGVVVVWWWCGGGVVVVWWWCGGGVVWWCSWCVANVP